MTERNRDPSVTDPHDPMPYCDCHQCALAERNSLRDRVQELQRALAFWHPGVPPEDSEFANRAGSDAWLLTGYEGPSEPSASDLGWIARVGPAVAPAVIDRDAKIPRLMYWEDAEDYWTLAPDLVENIIGIDQFLDDGDEQAITFRRMDLSEAEMDAMPGA